MCLLLFGARFLYLLYQQSKYSCTSKASKLSTLAARCCASCFSARVRSINPTVCLRAASTARETWPRHACCTLAAAASSTSEGARAPEAQGSLRCQCLYFGTSKTNKLTDCKRACGPRASQTACHSRRTRKAALARLQRRSLACVLRRPWPHCKRPAVYLPLQLLHARFVRLDLDG